MQAVCPACGGTFCDDPPPNGGKRKTYCSKRCRNRVNQARYQQTAKGKATYRRWRTSPKGKTAVQRYATSDRGRSAHKRYWHSERGRLIHRLYQRERRRMNRELRERDWALHKLRHDPAYRELIRQRISEEQKRRHHRERLLKLA